jgi:hypothetical protein
MGQIKQYRPGMAKVTASCGHNACDEGSCYDEDLGYDPHPGPRVYLPHSCDSFYIGGPAEVRLLIADLTKLLEEMERPPA